MQYIGRTDLAVELQEGVKREDDRGVNVVTKESVEEDIRETVIEVTNEEGAARIGKPVGTYITIESRQLACMDVSYHEPMMRRLMSYLEPYMRGKYHVMIVGLGNRMVTPDALGPMVVDHLCITRHLIKEDLIAAKYMYSAIAPGVMAQTGMETGELLQGMIEKTKPDLVIAVDALAARSADRLNKTIQLTDTGITPGSGVGNHRAALTERTLGVPVIGLGVPTVISVPSIIDAALDTMVHTLGKNGMAQILMELSDQERYALSKEMVTPALADMYVTPKNVDDAVGRISYTISEALNQMLGLDPAVLAYIH